jgi:hypothetical protein
VKTVPDQHQPEPDAPERFDFPEAAHRYAKKRRLCYGMGTTGHAYVATREQIEAMGCIDIYDYARR